MKTGLGIGIKIRKVIALINLIRFTIRKYLLGFEFANLFLRRVDNVSVQMILRLYGAKIGNNCDIESGITIQGCNNYSNLIVGNDCHIGKNCFFDLRDKVIIRNKCTISMGTTFITHQDLGKSDLKHKYNKYTKGILIEDNVYIGANTTILPGIKISGSSIIGANSVVRSNIGANTVFAGNPARFIKNIK